MPDDKDYTKLTLEELLIEKKNLKKNETLFALAIGLLAGVMLYGVVKNGTGYIYIIIPIFLIYGIYKHSKKLKNNLEQVRTEIAAKNSK